MSNSYGCKLSKIDVRDYKIKAKAGICLPESYEVQFEHHIKNQLCVGSCVAHSTAEILEYFTQKEGNYTKLSTNFIYSVRNALYGDTGTGMSLLGACRIVKKYGDMTYEDCPGNVEAPKCFEEIKPFLADNNKLNKAYTYRVDSYYRCMTNNDIKSAIMNYGPVLVAIKWYNKYTTKDGILQFDTTTEFGHHAVMLYGWNDKGFLMQNSWGVNFGNKGCVILPYEYKIEEARCLIDHDNAKDTEESSVIIPTSGAILDIIYKFINAIVNLLLRR